MSSNNDNENGNTATTKVAFSLGGKKKKKASSSSNKPTVTAADFGNHESTSASNGNNSNQQQNQAPLVIPLSQPSQSLFSIIKQEATDNSNNVTNDSNNGPENVASTTSSSSMVKQEEPQPPMISSNSDTTTNQRKGSDRPILQQSHEKGDGSKEQFYRDLEKLPDEADEEAYEKVPVSQFGAALLRGMGWKDEDNTTNDNDSGGIMPRPSRLGLGAIPKAALEMGNAYMPSVLTGKKNKQRKLSVAQLQQQEEFEKKRELQRKQDKQLTLQACSIVYLVHDTNDNNNGRPQRAKIVQLQGVPGLNMVKVHLEGDAQPCSIKKGQLGELVPRPELEKAPFVIPKPKVILDKKRSQEKERVAEGDHNDNRRRRDRDRRSRSHSRDRDSTRDRRRDRDRRSRSRSTSRERDRDRKRDRKHSRRDEDDRKDRDGMDRDRRRDDDDDRRDRKGKDHDRDKDRRRRRRDDERSSSEEHSDRGHRKDKRRDEKPRKKSRSEKEDFGNSKKENDNPLWVIPNIRVRVITEKLGKRYFRQKGVVVDVTRRHGATLRMDMADSSGRVLEHVPEHYLETALPKTGGQAVVLTGPNKWAKGRLLERNSKSSKGSIQVFEDMNIITLPLDDIAEWCGPLDDDLA